MDKPFTIENAWLQLNIVRDPVLRAEDDELPDGIHPAHKANITLLRNAWGAPRGDPETKRRIVAAYEAGDRIAARKLWGDLITSIFPVLREPPRRAGFALRR